MKIVVIRIILIVLLSSIQLPLRAAPKEQVYVGNSLINRLTNPYSPDSIAFELLPDADFIVHGFRDKIREGSSPAYIDNYKEREFIEKLSESRGEAIIVLIDIKGRVRNFWVRKAERLKPTELSPEVRKTYEDMLAKLKWSPAEHEGRKIAMLTIL